MWDKFFGSIKDFVVAGELTRYNTDDVRELRRRNDELSSLVAKLAIEVKRLGDQVSRLRENEAHEREKLLLRVEKVVLHAIAAKPSKPRNQKKLSG